MVLKGWKDIAKYVSGGVRTVQRWEKLGMPVRRPAKGKRSAVVAMSEEIDSWITHRSEPRGDCASSSDVDASQSRRFRHRILLVDEDERLLIAVATRLYKAGYDVRTARDGFEALIVMREVVPDLLVSDLRMPRMSGFELCSVVRQRFPSVAVIAYTTDFVSAGDPSILCDRIIAKGPKSNFELLHAIDELLTQSPLRTQPAKLTRVAAWIPRSVNGYFVLTCHDCLRSFSVLTCDGVIGEDAVAKCFYCAADVIYHIDESVLPIQDDLKEFKRYSSKVLASTWANVQPSTQMCEAPAQMERPPRKRKK